MLILASPAPQNMMLILASPAPQKSMLILASPAPQKSMLILASPAPQKSMLILASPAPQKMMLEPCLSDSSRRKKDMLKILKELHQTKRTLLLLLVQVIKHGASMYIG
jgi:hypothetical protein